MSSPNTAQPHDDHRLSVDLSLLIVRVILGIIFVYHGHDKLFDSASREKIVAGLGPVVGYLVMIGEFFGGLGLIAGFLTRFSAASLMVIMLGAIAMVHAQNGFSAANRGFEYNLALIGLCIPIFLAGPGRFSIGRYLPLPKGAGSVRPKIFLE